MEQAKERRGPEYSNFMTDETANERPKPKATSERVSRRKVELSVQADPAAEAALAEAAKREEWERAGTFE